MGGSTERRDSGNPLTSHFLPILPSGRVINQKPALFQGDKVIGVSQHFATDPSGRALRMRRYLQCRFPDGAEAPTPTNATIQWNFRPEKTGSDQENDRDLRFLEYTITQAKSKIAVFHPFQQKQAEVASFHVREEKPLRAFLYPQPKQNGDVLGFESDEPAVQDLRRRLLDILSNPRHTLGTLSAYGDSQPTFLGASKPDAENEASMIIDIANLVGRALPDDEDQQREARKLLEGLHAAQYVYSVHIATGQTGQPSVQFLARNISAILNSYQEKLPKNILRCDFNPDNISVVRVPTGAGHFFYEDDPDLDKIPAQEVNYGRDTVFPVSEDDPNGYGYIFTKEEEKVRITLVKGQHKIPQYSIVFTPPDQRKLADIGLKINSDFGQIPESVAPILFESPQGNLDTALSAAA